jgi:hypothetical protein
VCLRESDRVGFKISIVTGHPKPAGEMKVLAKDRTWQKKNNS